MPPRIPSPAVIRLCAVYRLCEQLGSQGVLHVSSSEIGAKLGVPAHSIRKDISHLGEIGNTKAGYDIVKLRDHIRDGLGLSQRRKACVVGLGRLGSAVLEHDRFLPAGFAVVAGFDSSINRLETIRTRIKVYPAHEMADVVKREGIELAVIAVPPDAAQGVADLLMSQGVKGIVNFSSVAITTRRPDVFIRNIDVVNEFRVLSSLIALETRNQD